MYPNIELYEKMYARYLGSKRVTQIAELLKDSVNQKSKVIDLCGGGGRLSEHIYKNSRADITLVDRCAEMIRESNNYKVKISNVEDFLKTTKENTVDAYVCQQAVNYWLNVETADYIFSSLKYRGVFIFNTFLSVPENHIRSYNINGDEYEEVIKYENNLIYHTQKYNNKEHRTQFTFISEESFSEMLKNFRILRINDGKTTLFKCEKLD